MSTIQHVEPRRGGRPRKSAADLKSEMLRIRVREALKRRLDDAAASNNRSLNEEVEARIENTFELEDIIDVMLSGESAGKFFVALASIVKAVQRYEHPPGHPLGKKDWLESDATRAALRSGFFDVINHLIPPPHHPDNMAGTSAQQKYYAASMQLMHEFGEECARTYTGRDPDLAEALNADGAPEH